MAIGPVYRRDNLDLTHTPMFHQVEGLVVGRGVTLADLKGTLTSMAAALFGEGQRSVSVRASSPTPSRAPNWTSAASAATATAARCASAPAGSRFLAAAWSIPTVFEFVGYDPDAVTGFAFGMGIERVALLKWGIEDIRLFYENDLRFLEQFGR